MKKQKKIISLFLALVLVMTGFVACGNQDTEPVTESTTIAPPTTTEPVFTDPVLPDPGAYLKLARNEDGCYGPDDDLYYTISYKTDLSYPQALHEYISLITNGKYPFELVYKYEKPNTFSYKDYDYYFKYTGTQDVPNFSTSFYDEAECNLVVSISYFPADGPSDYDRAYLSLNFNPEAHFEIVDPGVRTEFVLRDLSYVY